MDSVRVLCNVDHGHVHCCRYHDASRPVPDRNGHRVTDYGHGGHFGTHQARSHYGHIGQLQTKVGLVVDGQYADTPFNAFRYDVQAHRSQVLANPSVPTMPWICKKDWVGDSAYVTAAAKHFGAPWL